MKTSGNETGKKDRRIERAGILLLALCLVLSGAATAMASSPGVISAPSLFSVVKTDTSKNNNVEIIGNKMWFTPGKGIGGEMFGFQPGSCYYYENLCRIDNLSSYHIQVCYRLTGGFADLYEKGAFWLGIGDSYWIQSGVPSPNLPGGHVSVEKVGLGRGESSAPVNFYFSIDHGAEMKEYGGEIIFYAPYTAHGDGGGGSGGDSSQTDRELTRGTEPPAGRSEQEEELEIFPEKPLLAGTLPKTGESPPVLLYGIGLLLILAGIKLRLKDLKKRK